MCCLIFPYNICPKHGANHACSFCTCLDLQVAYNLFYQFTSPPITVAARSKAWVLRVRIQPHLSPVSAVCCQVEVSATGRSLVQRSPTECGESEWVHYEL